MRIAWSALLIVGLASSATAVDGVLEINQTCASGPGCFVGDTGGFPVQITARGSYRLTSNLTPPNQNTTVISITAAGVSVDLNGLAIQGTNTFSGPGGICSAPGSGVGVSGNTSNVAVSNGHVRGMGSTGVNLSGAGNVGNHRVERVIAEQNCGHGIVVGNLALVTDSVARRNSVDGFEGLSDGRFRNNVAEANGGSGIFQVGSSSRWIVEGCVANGNGATGIELPDNNGHLVTDSVASSNGEHGIAVGNNSLVLRSSANGNTQRGISANPSTGVGFLTANGNGTNVFGAPMVVACMVVGGAQSCP